MSEDVADLSLEQLKRELISLRRENSACFKTIEKLLKDINKKHEEIASLQKLVSQTVPVIQKSKETLEPEAEIADLQLERLRESAQTRALTLEETRAFDLLVKNKRLAQEKSSKNSSVGAFRHVNEIELIQVAVAPKLKLNDPRSK
jgi:hypothetical protein